MTCSWSRRGVSAGDVTSAPAESRYRASCRTSKSDASRAELAGAVGGDDLEAEEDHALQGGPGGGAGEELQAVGARAGGQRPDDRGAAEGRVDDAQGRAGLAVVARGAAEVAAGAGAGSSNRCRYCRGAAGSV